MAMLKSISQLLESLAERCLTTAAGMLTSTFDKLNTELRAEQFRQLQTLAQSYENEGQQEIAAAVRNQANRLLATLPAGSFEPPTIPLRTESTSLSPSAKDLSTLDATPRRRRQPRTANLANVLQRLSTDVDSTAVDPETNGSPADTPQSSQSSGSSA